MKATIMILVVLALIAAVAHAHFTITVPTAGNQLQSSGNTAVCVFPGNETSRSAFKGGDVVNWSVYINIAHGGGTLAWTAKYGTSAPVALVSTATPISNISLVTYTGTFTMAAGTGNGVVQCAFSTDTVGFGPYYQCVDFGTADAGSSGASHVFAFVGLVLAALAF